MTIALPEEEITSKVREACDYVNEIYDRLLLDQASEAEANLITEIAAEGLLHGRGAALTQALDLFNRLKTN